MPIVTIMTSDLETENRALRARVSALESELSFLRMHTAVLQGMKGETLVADLTGGELTDFAAEHDIVVGGSVTVEVKFSKLNTPVARAATRRWNWSKPLGWKDKGKSFAFLVLVGEKDMRYPNQYLDDAPYVFFLIPKARVGEILTQGSTIGANVQITTHLARARSPASLALKSFHVPAATVTALLGRARAT
ncbi:hypothetical protein BKK79_27640 [Cupriavidus sp. USMAA2-4]|nr:hypothetical protein BKK79_27640 [Cupriavidus sp. USMAA2-4]